MKTKHRQIRFWGLLLFLLLFAAGLTAQGSLKEVQAAPTGFQTANGKIYYYQNGRLYKKGWLKLNGRYYYMDKKTGAAKTGWVKNKEGYRYFDKRTGVLYNMGWFHNKEGYRYFDKKTGVVKMGWVKNKEGYRYFDKKTAVMYNMGWFHNKEGYRYFDKKTGVVKMGWVKNKEGYRYFSPKTAVMATGLFKVKSNTYRFLDPKTGVMWTGLKKHGKYYYYLDPKTGYRLQDASMTINGKIYTFDKGGRAVSIVPANSSKWNQFLTKYQKDSKTNQLVFVQYTGGAGANVLMYTKSGGKWKKLVDCKGYVGSGGIDKIKEGDKKTPSGIYSFTKAFGIKNNPGAKLPYTKINQYHYWCGDKKWYNQFVDIRKQPHTCRGEHLIDYVPAYNYALALDYNPQGVYGKGSAIFLHCTGYYPYTLGCISVSEANMLKIIRNIDAGAKIFIYPK